MNKSYNFAKYLVNEYKRHIKDGYEIDINDVDVNELQILSTHFIEEDRRDLSCIYENSEHDEIVSSLITLLNQDDHDNKLDFAELVRDRVVEHYKPKIQELFNEICRTLYHEDLWEEGFVTRIDRNTGEYMEVRA